MSQEWPVGRRHCELCVVIVDVTDEETLPMAWEGFVAQFLWRMAGEWGKGNPDGADDWVPSNPHPISLIRMGTRDTKNETHRTVAEEEGVSDQYLHLYEGETRRSGVGRTALRANFGPVHVGSSIYPYRVRRI